MQVCFVVLCLSRLGEQHTSGRSCLLRVTCLRPLPCSEPHRTSLVPHPTCAAPLLKSRAFVLVGDHNQLPPLVANREAEEGGMGVSLFRLLSEAHPQARTAGVLTRAGFFAAYVHSEGAESLERQLFAEASQPGPSPPAVCLIVSDSGHCSRFASSPKPKPSDGLPLPLPCPLHPPCGYCRRW